MAYPVIFNGDHAEFEREHANTPAKERPDWPLPSFDARDWAEAFCKIHPGFDDDIMVSWFANALMRGFDEGRCHAALSAPVEAPVACLNCGRPVGDHSMDTADVCNAFIGQEQPQYRCTICGFVIDTRYEATKPTIEFGMAGRAKVALSPQAPVAWLRNLPGNEAKPDGRCYDVVFVDPQDARYRPLYATARPLPSADDLARIISDEFLMIELGGSEPSYVTDAIAHFRNDNDVGPARELITAAAVYCATAILTLLGGSAHGR